ncbi:hypothetical protein D3C71_2249380 [compost metagenome]
MLFRHAQSFFCRDQQFINGGTGARFIEVHHVADPGTIEGIAGLQQVYPAFIQF